MQHPQFLDFVIFRSLNFIGLIKVDGLWGIREVGKGSWKEREYGKFLFKLESLANLERTERSWRQPSEVGKRRAKLESILKLGSFAAVGKFK